VPLFGACGFIWGMMWRPRRIVLSLALLVLLFHSAFYSVSAQAARGKNKANSEKQRDVPTLLYLAGTEPPPFTYRYRIQAARLLIEQKRLFQARRVLEDINPDQLADAEYQEYAPLYVGLLLDTQSAEQALELLYQDRLSRLLPGIEPAARLDIYIRRIDSQLRNNRPMLAFRESIRISALLEEEKRAINNQVIWSILMNTPLDTLKNQPQNTKSSDAATRVATGWLQLALLCRDYELGALKRHENMNRWIDAWPDHPAQFNLPPEALLLSEPPDELPRRVALMVPLSGQYADAGQAVRDGFLAAWYASAGRGDPLAEVIIIDTGSGEMADLYRKAVNSGARLIIGPLRRESVTALQRVRISVPVLSLNYLPLNRRGSRLYQFGLSPDDELEQLASYGRQQGWSDMILVRPQGKWSSEYAQNFTNIWLSDEDKYRIYEYPYLNERDISIVMEQALSIDKSVLRERNMERLLEMGVEAAPRRRKDIDWILFLGGAVQARLLTPVLRYHRADNIPLLSTARAFDGSTNRSANTDLNSIIFTEAPWLLEPSVLRTQLIEDQEKEQERRIARIYGLGTDAWRLLPWLKVLGDSSELSLYAASGRLSMKHGRIKRTSLWATIENSELKQLPGGDALFHLARL
jgi:outer membrane PBP1 activator LpoA protein